MKWCRFKYQNEIGHGIIENNMISPISGNPFSKYKKKEILLVYFRKGHCDIFYENFFIANGSTNPDVF